MSEPQDRLLELCEALVSEQITPEEHAELQALLKDHPEAQRRYLAHVDLHLGLQKIYPTAASEADPLADLAERAGICAVPAAQAARQEVPRERVWQVISALAASVAIGMTLLAWHLREVVIAIGPQVPAVEPPEQTPDAPPDQTPKLPLPKASSFGEAPRLVERAGARFFGPVEPVAGERLKVGEQYALVAGMVKLQYPSGATVVIEAPAAFEVPRFAGAERLNLRVGDCSVAAPPGAEGFCLETPVADVVDLGTRFAVRVGENGQTDVHVVEGLAEVYKPQGQGPRGKPLAKLGGGAAVRCEVGDELKAEPLTYDAGRYRRDLPDRVLRYDAVADASGGVDELLAVTVQRGGKVYDYPVDELIGVDLIHFKTNRSLSNITTPSAMRDPQQPKLAADEKGRRRFVEDDRRLTTGVINPGGSKEPLTQTPVMNDPEDPKKPNTSGMAMRFHQPVVNGPGADVVLFDLHVIVHPEAGDAFHVSPLEFTPGLKSYTVRKYDVGLTSPEAKQLSLFRLYKFSRLTTSLSDLERVKHDGGIDHAPNAKGLAVGIDLSDLGYPPGAEVSGLFIQDVLDDNNLVDPVFIGGLPAVK